MNLQRCSGARKPDPTRPTGFTRAQVYLLAKMPTNTLHQIVREIQIHASFRHQQNVLPLAAAVAVCSRLPGASASSVMAPLLGPSKPCCFNLRVGFFSERSPTRLAKSTSAPHGLRAASAHSPPRAPPIGAYGTGGHCEGNQRGASD